MNFHLGGLLLPKPVIAGLLLICNVSGRAFLLGAARCIADDMYKNPLMIRTIRQMGLVFPSENSGGRAWWLVTTERRTHST